MSEQDAERASRIAAVAKDIVSGAEALDRCDWPALERCLDEACRQVRVLRLIEERENTKKV